MLNPFQRSSDPYMLMVGMTGVKMGDRLAHIGCAHGGQNNEPETLFDGATFDPVKAEEYAKSFPVNNLKG